MEASLSLLKLCLFCSVLFACNYPEQNNLAAHVTQVSEEASVAVSAPIDTAGKTLTTRILPPEGYTRTRLDTKSFGFYLRHLPLKPHGSPVYCFDGREKWNQSVHAAVVDLDVGTRDLQQCADAVMRLRAEYLWQQEAYDQISFNFTNGFAAPYAPWRAGQRIRVSGNTVAWVNAGRPDRSYAAFRKYLDMVFAYAGTLSLAEELKSKALSKIAIGDVFIQGGSPGHAVTVVDLAREEESGKIMVLLAQSYMPAQDIHILKNPGRTDPWYLIDEHVQQIRTPEWTFSAQDLKAF